MLEPLLRLGGRHEELHLHLLELAGAEDEVAGRDLVAERLADLGDPERRLLARELEHVLEVDEDPLRRLGAQVGDREPVSLTGPTVVSNIRLNSRASVRSHVAVPRPAASRASGRAARVLELVGAEALLAGAAVDERVGEPREVAARLPHPRVLEDRRVERDDVVALGEHRPPPLVLHVVLQQDAVVAVVVGRADPAVDLRRGEDEAAPLAERHDLVHRHAGRAGSAIAAHASAAIGVRWRACRGRDVVVRRP